MSGDRKNRPDPYDLTPQGRSSDAGQRDRNDAAWLPFEEQQFDGEHDRRDRRRKRRRHAGGRSGDEQRLALGARQVKELGDERSASAARHDDRTFGAEWTAGSD